MFCFVFELHICYEVYYLVVSLGVSGVLVAECVLCLEFWQVSSPKSE